MEKNKLSIVSAVSAASLSLSFSIFYVAVTAKYQMLFPLLFFSAMFTILVKRVSSTVTYLSSIHEVSHILYHLRKTFVIIPKKEYRESCLEKPQKSDNLFNFLFGFFMMLLLILSLLTFPKYGASKQEINRIHEGKEFINHYLAFFGIQKSPHTKNNPKIKPSSKKEEEKIAPHGNFFDFIAEVSSRIIPEYQFEMRHLVRRLFILIGIAGVFSLGKFLGSSKTGFLAAILCSITPAFYGASACVNLPLASTFIWAMYYIIRVSRLSRPPTILTSLKLGISIGLASVSHSSALILILYATFAYIVFIKKYLPTRQKRFDRRRILIPFFTTLISFYTTLFLFWPYVQKNIITKPVLAFLTFKENYPAREFVYNGVKMLWKNMPYDYIARMLFIKLPEIFWIILGAFIILSVRNLIKGKQVMPIKKSPYIILFASLLIPFFYAIIKRPVPSGGLSSFLFVVPIICVLSAVGLMKVLKGAEKISFKAKAVASCLTFAYLGYHLSLMIALFPYEYTYFNIFAGGLKNASKKYEVEYRATAMKEAVFKTKYFLKTIDGEGWVGRQYLIKASPIESAKIYFSENFVNALKLTPHCAIQHEGEKPLYEISENMGTKVDEVGRLGTTFVSIIALR